MLTQAQYSRLKPGSPVSFAGYARLFYVRTEQVDENNNPLPFPNVILRDMKGKLVVVVEWQFIKFATLTK